MNKVSEFTETFTNFNSENDFMPQKSMNVMEL